MSIKIIAMPLLVSLLIVTGMSCGKAAKSPEAGAHKLKVVASLYPLYDFVRNIGKDKVDVELLLPPGVEPHSFEPNPADILHLNHADIFVYTNKYMEPWVEDILRGMDSGKMLILDSSRGVLFTEERDDGEEGHHSKEKRGHAGMDPHIWLDLGNAIMMVDTIRDGLIQRDPANQDYYQKNAAQYKTVLQGLDMKFRQGLSSCKKRVFINGGHFAFEYLARRYGLTYVSAYGFSPDAEPTPGQLVKISRIVRKQGLKYLFYEELLTPRVAEMLARETGVQLLFLHGAHNISKEEFARGVSFVELMEKNLENLETGLQCR
jgi:zinc transport system substrate-binding protein